MTTQVHATDADLLDLLRVTGPTGVSSLAKAIEVTATAVRQRLMRLMGRGLIQREAVRAGRGRPKHLYRLTEEGLRLTGSNFTDLALALWQEISSVEDPNRRKEMVQRIAGTLAAEYADRIGGDTTAERMQSLGELLSRRRIPVSVEVSDGKVVLTKHACPYPRLAERDRDICHMEKLLISQLVGRDVELIRCRQGEGGKCRFQAS